MTWPPPKITHRNRTDDSDTSAMPANTGSYGAHATDHNQAEVAVNALVDQVTEVLSDLGDLQGQPVPQHLEWEFHNLSTITIPHGFGLRPNVDLLNDAGARIAGFECEHLDQDTVTIRLSQALDGYAILTA